MPTPSLPQKQQNDAGENRPASVDEDYQQQTAQASRMLRGLVVALVGWGLLLGFGAYLGLDDQTPSGDPRRLAIVTGVIGGFVAVWLTALALRRRRRR